MDRLMFFLTAVSAFFTAIAALASVVATKLARDSLRLQAEQSKLDRPNLEVTVNPTRTEMEQLAQIRVVNKSRRPAHIDAWYVEYPGGASMSGETRPHASPFGQYHEIPAVMEEAEELNILVSLAGVDWRKITQIGVVDRGQALWPASAQNLKSFLEIAERYAPDRHATAAHGDN